MKNRYNTYVILIFFLFFMILGKVGLSQNRNIDSLLTLIKTDQPDTNKVKHLYSLSSEYINIGLYDTAKQYGNLALQLALQLLDGCTDNNDLIQIKKGIARSYHNIGTVYYLKGEYFQTLGYWLSCLKTNEELNDKGKIANNLNNIGLVYYKQGEYGKALDNYFKALKMAEELKDKTGISTDQGNIGLVYYSQGNYSKALDYYFKALKISEELNDKKRTIIWLTNIGLVYTDQNNYSEALDCYFKALPIIEELGDKSANEKIFGNLGFVYEKKATSLLSAKNSNKTEIDSLYTKALYNHFKALKIAEELGNKEGISTHLGNIGSIYVFLKKYNDAYIYIKKAIAISDSIGVKDNLSAWYSSLSVLYEKTNIPLPDSTSNKMLNIEQMRLLSMFYYKKSIAIRDALFSEEAKKQLIQKEMKYEFDKKETITKAKNEKKQAVAEEKNRKQKLIIVLVTCVLMLVFVFTFFIFRSLSTTRKQKEIIEIKSKETEEQKKIIEEKNKDITDSINYAKQIQRALLREEEHVSSHLPEHAILFMPKDIVSGDFYWAIEKEDYWYFAVADCTGHGVPGAIMSMLGISFLNDISFSEKLLNPNEILNKLRERIIYELRQSDESIGNRDGMDISLCKLNLKTLELQWAGANNSLNLIRNGDLEIIKADKQPIGYYPNPKPFTNHTIQLQKGDSIYIYSDGYADQFGGEKGKKLTYKRLENLLIEKSTLSLKEQKELLKKAFIDWKGSLEQVDDVCIIGVRA